MALNPIIERIIYTLVILLSLVALFLVLSSPSSIMNTREVYQGF